MVAQRPRRATTVPTVRSRILTSLQSDQLAAAATDAASHLRPGLSDEMTFLAERG